GLDQARPQESRVHFLQLYLRVRPAVTLAGTSIERGQSIPHAEVLSAFESNALQRSRPRTAVQALLERRRVRLLITLAAGALLPFALRVVFRSGGAFQPSAINSLVWNGAAIVLAFWMRLSMETYPGVRRAYLLLFSATTTHLLALAWFIFTREPYDRVAL